MRFTNDNIKYCLLTWDHLENEHVSHFIEPVPITGLFNWSLLFNGVRTFPRTADDFAKYNVIHVNITHKNLPLLSKIIPLIDRNVTKLLVNVDYAIEMWSQTFPHPELLLQEIDGADYIFAVEPNMADLLSSALQRYVPCIPHPCATHEIEKYRTNQREKKVMISAHRYDTNFQIPYFFTRRLPDNWISCIMGAHNNFDSIIHLYHECQRQLTFEESIKYISTKYAMVETHTLNSYGRVTIEAAVLGVPCIGPANISSMQRCFPDLIYKHHASPVNMMCCLFDKLQDQAFYSEVAKKAIEASKYYSYDNCRSLMLDFLNS
jgi:hypothetical protein